ncbi:MAG TPA: sugar ABC transporter permease [Thermotogota bacterium]|nr:sugar ABC transporter permease [Thermotogota bacterium]HPJ89939.1 sugar ABC transporter permease [Thermotogota bacterium]HPR96638.1 sugar ABC transporter permease [Thermotogota bacterium]
MSKRLPESGKFLPAFLRNERTMAFIFLIPSVLIIGVFNIYPALYSIVLSFFKWNGFSPKIPFVGLENYRTLFTNPEFYNSIGVTIVYSLLVTIISMGLGLLVAVALDRDIKGKTLYRILYFLPVVTPTVASGIVWTYLFDPSQGIINRTLAFFSITGPSWLTDSSWALLSVSIVGIWKRVGFCMIIYLAALQGISNSLYEAAEIDGAGDFKILKSIKIPLLAPSTLFLSITGFIDSFQIFDLVYVMTNGGPVDETDVLGLFLYRNGFDYFKLGYSSAIAVAIFAILFLLSFVQWKYTGGGDEN